MYAFLIYFVYCNAQYVILKYCLTVVVAFQW